MCSSHRAISECCQDTHQPNKSPKLANRCGAISHEGVNSQVGLSCCQGWLTYLHVLDDRLGCAATSRVVRDAEWLWLREQATTPRRRGQTCAGYTLQGGDSSRTLWRGAAICVAWQITPPSAFWQGAASSCVEVNWQLFCQPLNQSLTWWSLPMYTHGCKGFKGSWPGQQ